MIKINSRTLNPKNLIRMIGLSISGSHVVAKYSQTPETKTNWGDAVNPVIISHFSGKSVININDLAYYNGDVFAVIGSILDNNKVENLCIYGSGFKDFKSKMHVGPKKVHAVRGPLTRKKLLEAGYDSPEVYGDPAILYKKIYDPSNPVRKHKLGIIPHYTEKNSKLLSKLPQRPDVVLIDIQGDLNKVIDEVLSCEHIVSSSLHGLIIADTYNVPSAWIKIEGNLMGDDFKFLDYYSALNESKPVVYQIDEDSSDKTLIDLTRQRSTDPLVPGLLQSMPF